MRKERREFQKETTRMANIKELYRASLAVERGYPPRLNEPDLWEYLCRYEEMVAIIRQTPIAFFLGKRTGAPRDKAVEGLLNLAGKNKIKAAMIGELCLGTPCVSPDLFRIAENGSWEEFAKLYTRERIQSPKIMDPLLGIMALLPPKRFLNGDKLYRLIMIMDKEGILPEELHASTMEDIVKGIIYVDMRPTRRVVTTSIGFKFPVNDCLFRLNKVYREVYEKVARTIWETYSEPVKRSLKDFLGLQINY